ncbi:MAG: DUF4333 domain-containing protein [Candidatus Nanopelagicales bacterium]
MLRRTPAALATVLVALSLAVAGCSGSVSIGTTSETPSASPSTSTSASGSPSPQTTAVAEGTLDQNVLAQAISSNLSDSLGADVAVSVVCPAGVAIKKGATSECTAQVDGQQLGFTVTQADTEGNVDFAATAAVLDVVKLQTQTAEQYGQQKGGTWTADCGSAGKAFLVQAVGASFDCTFTSSSGDTKPYTVTVKDLDGNVSWSEK